MAQHIIRLNETAQEVAHKPQRTEDEWATYLMPMLSARAANDIEIGRALLECKDDLNGRNGSFTHLVEVRFGHSLDWAERLMSIARHPILGDSARVRTLPSAMSTRAVLTRLQLAKFEAYYADGIIHPGLKREEAEALVRANSSNGHATSSENEDDIEEAEEEETQSGNAPGERSTAPVNDPGPDSLAELERLRVRNAELENNILPQLKGRIDALESEIRELNAKITAFVGPQEEIRAEKRLFLRALRILEKAEATNVEKDQRSLRNDAITYLVELIRTAARNGHNNRLFDLVYLPTLH